MPRKNWRTRNANTHSREYAMYGNLARAIPDVVWKYKVGNIIGYWIHTKQRSYIQTGEVIGCHRQGTSANPRYTVTPSGTEKTQRIVQERDVIGLSMIQIIGQPYVSSKYLTVSTETRGVLSAQDVKRILRNNKLQNKKP